MNTNTTTIPAAFTKGSGKKIAAAYSENGWTLNFEESPWGGAKMTATAEATIRTDGHTINLHVVVQCADNGAFIDAMMTDETVDKWSNRLDTMSDTVAAAARPTIYTANTAKAIAAEQAKQARDKRAAVVEAEFAAVKDTDADEQRWERRALVRIAEQEVSFTIDGRYSVTSQMGDAMTIIQKQYEITYAERILALEGRYNEATDRCFTLAEAVTQVIMRAVSDSDGTRYETAVPHAKAIQRIANRWF